VIAKSTYESWSVGVHESSVFVVDDECEARAVAIADEIGQPVTIQEFIAGPEVCVSVFSCPEVMVAPPIEAVLTKAPGNPAAITTVDDNLQKGAVSRRRFAGTPELLEQIRESTLAAFDILELEAFARIDFRVDSEGLAWLTDVGVSPGLAEGNSAFSATAELGFDYPEFLRIVIAATLASRGLL
jgi:D-alanine-D-alanine ligase